MHISIDCRFLYASGLGRYINNIVSILIMNTEIDFSLIMYESDFPYYNHFNRPNVQILYANAKMYSIKEQFEIPIKVPTCDVFWAPHYNISLLPIRAKRKVVTILDVNHLVFYNTLSVVQKLYASTIMFGATRLSDQIITISQFSKDEIVKYTKINKDKISVTHIAVDTDKFTYQQNSNYNYEYLYKRYNIPKRFLLYVGNVKPHKNINRMLKAFSIVKKVCPGIKLVIVGKKDNFITGVPAIEKDILSLDINEDVFFTGFVEDADLTKLYKLADLFIFPSLYEGFGLPPLEAMASGCAVVVSNSSSFPEVCEDAAFYVDPTNEKSIANGIIEVLNNTLLKEKLIQKGFEQVKKYSWKNAANKTLDILVGG